MEIFDIFLLEALINGLLFGGVLALLSLGLNLIFGVIDVVWICYAELVMFGMYTMYWLTTAFGFPIILAAPVALLVVAIMGFLVHYLVIAPILGSPPINQLLATGGVLFFLQSVATLMWSIEYRNLGLRLPVLEFAEMYFSYARLLSFGVAIAGMAAVWVFLNKTYMGAAIRAISQDREIMVLMGVDSRKVYLVTSLIGGALAGLAAVLLALQYDVHPFVGLSFGPITFIICVLGGLGNMLGGFIAAFVLSEIIAVGGLYSALEWGYVYAFVVFIVVMFFRPQGLLGEPVMNKSVLYGVGLIALASVPFIGTPQYFMHIMITILIWSFCYTGWSLMGRFGLVSLGHGAFMSIGAYGTALLWNHLELTPWIGIPASLICAAAVAFLVGYPCFRFKIVGHYFALVTLALSEVVRLVIIAERDSTGGSLGYTPERYGDGASLFALQFPDKETFYLIALGVWAVGLLIWHLVDRSMTRYAMDAIAEDEDASSSAGVWVSMTKLRITILSAVMTAFAGVMYAQYQMFIAPDTVGGIGVSLQIVFATVAGGMYVMLGPTVGAIITILLAETLRVMIGTSMVGLDTTIYGLMLVLFIIFLPKGVLGETLARLEARRERGAGGVADTAR